MKLGGMGNNQMQRKGYVCHISRILILNDNLTRKLAHLKCHVSIERIGFVILRHLHIILTIEYIALNPRHIKRH